MAGVGVRGNRVTTGDTQAADRMPGDETDETDERRTVAGHEHETHDEIVGGPWQRLAISALIVLVLLTLLATNAPDSAIKSSLVGVLRPVILVTGLDQRWGVFAPNPRIETSNVVARVERADGTVATYPLDSSAGLSEYWNYRWRKYGEQLWTAPSAERERVAFARWVADQDRAAGHQPQRVTLLRITRPNLPPGPGPDTGPWSEVAFSTTTVGTR